MTKRAASRSWPMVVALVAVCALASKEPAAQTAKPPLTLEKIPLGGVAGRIDHMAIDLARNRLFVAELGNNSVGVVDLTSRKVVHRIAGLKEPQGVAYAQATDTLYVATRGDGSLRIFRGQNYTPVARVELDSDADNVRIDASAGQVIVGYGDGALAVIDMANHRKIGSMPLKGHPESFQLDPSTSDVFINLPDVRALVVLDRVTGQVRNSWTVPYGGNFAMALDNEAQRVLSVFRDPNKLVAFSKQTGSVMEQVNTCSDVDDVFLDAARNRIYTSCGEGFIDVRTRAYGPTASHRLVTVPGAGHLFVSD